VNLFALRYVQATRLILGIFQKGAQKRNFEERTPLRHKDAGETDDPQTAHSPHGATTFAIRMETA
jgi:hypothetical protein